MIEMEWSGKLPDFDIDLTDGFEEAANYMQNSVLLNLALGGRPEPWPLKKDGTVSHLMKSGALISTARTDFGKDFALFAMGAGLPYWAIHNYGGTIQHPGSDKFQVFEIDGQVIFTHGTKAHPIPIPQREYMMLQEEDLTKLIDIVGTSLLRHITAKGETVNVG